MRTIKSFGNFIVERTQQEDLALLDKIIKTEPQPSEVETDVSNVAPPESTETSTVNEPKRPTKTIGVKGPRLSDKAVKGPGPVTPNQMKYDSSKNLIFPSIDNSLSTFGKPKILFTQAGSSLIKTLNWGRHSGHNIDMGKGKIGITLLSDTPQIWITHSGGGAETQRIGNVLKEQGLTKYVDFQKPNSLNTMIMVTYEQANTMENSKKVIKSVVNLLKMYGLVR